MSKTSISSYATVAACAIALATAATLMSGCAGQETIDPNETPKGSLTQVSDMQAENTAPAPDAVPGEGACASGHDWRISKTVEAPAITTPIVIEGFDDDGNACGKWVVIDERGYYVNDFLGKIEAENTAEAHSGYSVKFVAEYASNTFYILDSEAVQHIEYTCRKCDAKYS